LKEAHKIYKKISPVEENSCRFVQNFHKIFGHVNSVELPVLRHLRILTEL